MENEVKVLFDNLASSDDKISMAAFQEVMKITEIEVNWVYDVWDDVGPGLTIRIPIKDPSP